MKRITICQLSVFYYHLVVCVCAGDLVQPWEELDYCESKIIRIGQNINDSSTVVNKIPIPTGAFLFLLCLLRIFNWEN